MKLDIVNRRLAPSAVLWLTFCTVSVASHNSPALFPDEAAFPGTSLAQRYSRLPMSFEPNQGQADPRVQFLSRGRGYALLLTSTEAVLSLREGKGRTRRAARAHAAIGMTLEGATPGIVSQGLGLLPGTVNYFVGNDPNKWRWAIATYAKVMYPQIYPGIDLVYYGNQRELEFDFVVAPSGDPSRIGLSFKGADELAIGGEGQLLLHLGDRIIQWHKPVVYQEADGRREEISAQYVFKEKGLVGFEVGPYDPTRPLIIDPVMVYSSFLGGDDDDLVKAITVGSGGFAFVCGQTASIDFPTRFALDSSPNGSSDVFVTKLGAAGAALSFSTYLGGSNDDEGLAIAVDRNNLVYVAGQTASANFPRLNAFQNTLSGGLDAFVTKLGASGTNLLYSTLFGGSGFEAARGIAVDGGGNAYVVGETDSGQDFPKKNQFQNNSGGFLDAFVARFSTTASGSASLIYSSWLGGRDDERANAVVIDAATNVYLCGDIFSPDLDMSVFPTRNAVQPDFGGGFTDGFVAKLSAGTAPGILFATFLGGKGEDSATALALGPGNSINITGSTDSTNFPILNAMQPIIGGGGDFFTSDAFVTRLNSGGSSIFYSTYLGGELLESGEGIAVDASGNIYVAGMTTSEDFPVTLGADQALFGGGASDGFVSKFTPAFSGPLALIYSTFLGGIEEDSVEALALDASDNFYVAGQTSSDDFRVTTGSFQTNLAGGFSDGFVTKYASPADLSIATTTAPENALVGSNLTYTIRVNNNGRSQFSGVTLTDPLPASLQYISHSTTRGNCSFNSSNSTLTCNLGIMASNMSAMLTLVTRPRVAGTTTNTIRVAASESENNRGNNTNIVITAVRSIVDLTLTQTDFPDPVAVTSNLTYRMEIRNKGPGSARSVTLTNRLPAGAVIVPGGIPLSCFAFSNTVVCLLGNLPDGASNILEIVVTNRALGPVTSTANLVTIDFDPLPENNVAVTTTTVIGIGTDLSITGSAAPSPTFVGSNLTYTLLVSNGGPFSVTNAVVTDTLPPTVQFISSVSTQGSCTNSGRVVTCNLGPVLKDGTARIDILVMTTATGLTTNRATVASERPENNSANNTSVLVVTVSPQADVAIDTSGSPDPIAVGYGLSYVTVVRNRGPSTASNLTVIDTLPAGSVYLSHNSTHGSCAFVNGEVRCNIPSLLNGEMATISILVHPPPMNGTYTNVARVNLATMDPAPANNMATFVSHVYSPPAITIDRAGANVVLSWPSSIGAFRLQSAPSLSPPIDWQEVSIVPAVIDGQNVVTQQFFGTMRFYRLID